MTHVISNHVTTMLEILMIILAIYGYELAHVNVNVHVTMKTQFIVAWLINGRAPQGHLFSTGFNVYIYIYIFVSLTRVCVVYIVKEVTSFQGAWSINWYGI